MLTKYLDHCTEQASKESTKPRLPALDQIRFQKAVKELMSISLWLSLFEQASADTPDWFKQFILVALRASDRLHPEPNSKSIMQNYDLGAELSTICETASFHVCSQLEMGASCSDALIYLGLLLSEAQTTRYSLLRTALTEPVDSLDSIIRSHAQ